MLTDYPAPFYPGDSAAPLEPRSQSDGGKLRSARGLWRYRVSGQRRSNVIIAVLISIGIHASAFLFIGPTKERGARVLKDETPTIALTMPNLEDIEEPDRTATDSDQPVDATAFVPTQADLPQMPRPDDFVQKIDFNSLIERPDMSAAKVFAVPDNINRGAAIRQSIGTIFNLADLDRIPQALFQPPPVFPAQYKHDVTTATVRVQFIVDTNGNVVRPFVVDSTHVGFNEAATVGVGKWKFKPGIKAGRRVNTRMEVPIIFTTVEE